MSATLTPVPAGAPTPVAEKQKRTRSPSPPKPTYVVLQILGEDGKPMEFDAKRVKMVKLVHDKGVIINVMYGKTIEHAIVLLDDIAKAEAEAA